MVHKDLVSKTRKFHTCPGRRARLAKVNVRFMSSDSTYADGRLPARPAHADGGYSLCVAMCIVFKGKDVLRVTSALAHSVSAA